MDKQLNLDDIVLIGRTFDEYARMFALDDDLLVSKTILDVASGVSSFCAEANSRGLNVTATDKIYTLSPFQIEQKCKQDLAKVVDQLPNILDLYVWNYFKDVQSLKIHRERAYKTFIDDLKAYGAKRYIPTRYPETEFSDNRFSISLVSHLLFLYENHLDYYFHKMAILELARITSQEIRIFPVVNLKGEQSAFIKPIMQDKDLERFRIRLEKVDYEFLKNGNEMMVIRLID